MCLSLEIFCLFPLVLVSSLCVIVWLSFYSFTQLSCATTHNQIQYEMNKIKGSEVCNTIKEIQGAVPSH